MNNITLTTDVNSKVGLVKSIANKTRGPYTPEKYGNVIIPMAIIRRFDCILAKKNADIKKIVEATSKIKGMTAEKVEEMVKLQCGVPFYNAKCVTLEDLVGDSDNLDANFLEYITTHFPICQAAFLNFSIFYLLIFTHLKKTYHYVKILYSMKE